MRVAPKRKVEVYEPPIPVSLTRQTAMARLRMTQLKREISAAMHEPLNPGGQLHWTERERITERVRTGLRQQAAYYQQAPRR